MAYKRTRKAIARPRKKVKKTGGYTKPTTKMVMYKRPREGTLNIKRSFYFGNWAPNTAATVGFWRPFYLALNQVPGYTDFTNMFESFKISALKFTLVGNYTSADANQVNTGGNILNKPTVHVCYDKFTTVPVSGTYTSSTFNAFMRQGKIKTMRDPFRPINIYVSRPAVNEWGATGVSNGSEFKTSPWMRTDTALGVSHFGPNVFIHDPNFTGSNLGPYSWDIYVVAYLKFANQK